jgi:alkylation response protein AidB-like acyl-CoA dehydrogenase
MAIGIRDEHEELRLSVRGWCESRCTPSVVRAALDAPDDALPPFWGDLAAQGILGIHAPEEFGGQGAGPVELAVVAEELGRAAAPGPWATTAVVGAVLAECGAPCKEFLPGVVDGTTPASLVYPVATPGGSAAAPPGLVGTHRTDGSLHVGGTVEPIVNGTVVTLVLAPVETEGSTLWVLLVRSDASTVDPVPSFDPARPSATWAIAEQAIPPGRILSGVTTGRIRDLALLVASAEAVGGARWCLETAAEHARNRHQFGRPIGQFQGVKHRLADMLVRIEQSVAATWDAASSTGELSGGPSGEEANPDDHDDHDGRAQAHLSVQLAAALALDGYVGAANGAIQVLGGMGFTWEHDAHVHLRRATTLRQLVGGTAPLRAEAARMALTGTRRRMSVELPPEADDLADRLRPVVHAIAAMDDPAVQRRALAEEGLLAPHWPTPWGRDADPVEQLVIERLCQEEGLRRPNLAVAAWALPTIIAHGTDEQRERFVTPTLRGDVVWCQLFSEPGAGSDLAALATRATKVAGGWSLEGQKVWTSVAQRADMGICLARTDPDAPKHRGITYFLVDMRSPGITVRPLREITGAALFNEVFFDGCVVPDECVVGEVNGGWLLARTTLANERVSLSSDSAFGGTLEMVLALVSSRPELGDPVTLDRLGALMADAQSLAQLGLRATIRSVSRLEPGPESSVRKLAGAEFDQRVHEFGLDLLGPQGVRSDGAAASWAHGVLQSKCLTIAGGTSEVQRNVIGERLLGLPRDPEPGR